MTRTRMAATLAVVIPRPSDGKEVLVTGRNWCDLLARIQRRGLAVKGAEVEVHDMWTDSHIGWVKFEGGEWYRRKTPSDKWVRHQSGAVRDRLARACPGRPARKHTLGTGVDGDDHSDGDEGFI